MASAPRGRAAHDTGQRPVFPRAHEQLAVLARRCAIRRLPRTVGRFVAWATVVRLESRRTLTGVIPRCGVDTAAARWIDANLGVGATACPAFLFAAIGWCDVHGGVGRPSSAGFA